MPLYSKLPMPLTQSTQFNQAALSRYLLDHAYDEMFAGRDELHGHYRPLLEHFATLPANELQRRKQAADLSFLNQGITFTVYGRDEGTEQIFPYDMLPRIITSAEWETVERGLTQRITALNLFLKDIYNEGGSSRTGSFRGMWCTAVSTFGGRCVGCRCRATCTSRCAART